MKKASIFLLVFCMFLCTLVIPVSAARFAVGSYVEKINPNGSLLADNIKAITSGTGFNIPVTATAKTSGAELNAGTTTITAENVDNIITFKRGTTPVTFTNDLAAYFDVSGSVYGSTAVVYFTSKTTNNMDVYRVKDAIDTTTDVGDVSAKLIKETSAEKFILSPYTVTVSNIKYNTRICSIHFGSLLYHDGNVYDMNEIAPVQASVRKSNGVLADYSSVNQSAISGLQPGEEIYLRATLADPGDADYYMFNGWVDGSDNLISRENYIAYYAEGKDVAFYASYVLVKPYIRLNADTLKMTYKQIYQMEAFPGQVRWESSNPKAVRVDAETGVLEAVGAGKSTITAYTWDGAKATCEVTVKYTFVQILIRIFLFGWIWY